VQLLDNGQTPTITVQDSSAFEFTIDRKLAQGLLTDAGFTDVTLPKSLDDQPITVELPASVSAAYGVCPTPDMAETEPENVDFRAARECVILAQLPSPTVTAPPDLDVAQLAQIGLQFIGMSETEARQMSEAVDWATTLVIPIPRNAASVTEVSVDGVTGTLLTRYPDEGMPDRYTLLWVKNEIIYAISGYGYSSEALQLASQLK
jgi:hypothetical protein